MYYLVPNDSVGGFFYVERRPFRFLDAYTKEDEDIFFGREDETDELYARIFLSNMLLVYGVSGSGKTSLIQCGLANKIKSTDWLPICVRRNKNFSDSLKEELSTHASKKAGG